jgi:hypothetical protein
VSFIQDLPFFRSLFSRAAKRPKMNEGIVEHSISNVLANAPEAQSLLAPRSAWGNGISRFHYGVL